MAFVPSSSQSGMDSPVGSSIPHNILQNGRGSLGSHTLLTEKDFKKIAANRLKIAIFHIKNIIYIIKVSVLPNRSIFQRTIKSDYENFETCKVQIVAIVNFNQTATQDKFNALLQQLNALKQNTKSPYIKRYIQNIQERLNGYQVQAQTEERKDLAIEQDKVLSSAKVGATPILGAQLPKESPSKGSGQATPKEEASFIIHARPLPEGDTRLLPPSTPFTEALRQQAAEPSTPLQHPREASIAEVDSTSIIFSSSFNYVPPVGASLPDPFSYHHPYFVDDVLSNGNYQHLSKEERSNLKDPKWERAKQIKLATINSLHLWKDEILTAYDAFVEAGKALSLARHAQTSHAPTPVKSSPAAGNTHTPPPPPPPNSTAKKPNFLAKLLTPKTASQTNILIARTAVAEQTLRRAKSTLQTLLFPLHPNLHLVHDDAKQHIGNVEALSNALIQIVIEIFFTDIESLEEVKIQAKAAPATQKPPTILNDNEKAAIKALEKTKEQLKHTYKVFQTIVKEHNDLVNEHDALLQKFEELKYPAPEESLDQSAQRAKEMQDALIAYEHCKRALDAIPYKENYEKALLDYQKVEEEVRQLLRSDKGYLKLVDGLNKEIRRIKNRSKAPVLQGGPA